MRSVDNKLVVLDQVFSLLYCILVGQQVFNASWLYLAYLALCYDTLALFFLHDFSGTRLRSPLLPFPRNGNPKCSPALPGWREHPLPFWVPWNHIQLMMSSVQEASCPQQFSGQLLTLFFQTNYLFDFLIPPKKNQIKSNPVCCALSCEQYRQKQQESLINSAHCIFSHEEYSQAKGVKWWKHAGFSKFDRYMCIYVDIYDFF